MSDVSWRVSLADLVAAHYEAMLQHYGATVGVRHARKHLGWYLDMFTEATGSDLSADRSALLREGDPTLVAQRLKALFGRSTIADVERRDATDRKAA
jgi:tRNA-dihydrouridine synthase